MYFIRVLYIVFIFAPETLVWIIFVTLRILFYLWSLCFHYLHFFLAVTKCFCWNVFYLVLPFSPVLRPSPDPVESFWSWKMKVRGLGENDVALVAVSVPAPFIDLCKWDIPPPPPNQSLPLCWQNPTWKIVPWPYLSRRSKLAWTVLATLFSFVAYVVGDIVTHYIEDSAGQR